MKALLQSFLLGILLLIIIFFALPMTTVTYTTCDDDSNLLAVNNITVENNMIKFDGISSYLQADTKYLPAHNDFTLSVFIDIPESTLMPHGALFAQHQNGMFYAYTHYGTCGEDNIRFNAFLNNYQLLCGPSTKGQGLMHVAITRQNNNWTLYIDGQYYTSAIYSVPLATADNLRLGAEGSGTLSRVLHGYANQFLIYNRSLSSSEINEISKTQPHSLTQISNGLVLQISSSSFTGTEENPISFNNLICPISPSMSVIYYSPEDSTPEEISQHQTSIITQVITIIIKGYNNIINFFVGLFT